MKAGDDFNQCNHIKIDKKGRTSEIAYKTAYSGDELNILANYTGEIMGQQEVKGTDMTSESDRRRLSF